MKNNDTTPSPEPTPKKLTVDAVKRTRGGLRVSTRVSAGTRPHYNKIKW